MGVKSFDVKETNFGERYLETSNTTRDDTSRVFWSTPLSPDPNPGGYISPAGSKVISASGDSKIPGGALYGDPYLTWEDFIYEPGVLEIKAYDSPASYAAGKEANVVATDKLVTAGTPYTINMKAYKDKKVMAADGESLIYVECDIVDENGNFVPDANNLVEFYVSGAAVIAGVDSGENNSYSLTTKYGNVQYNTQSQYYAYSGKVLAILQSVKGLTGNVQLIAKAKGMQPGIINLRVTEDGTGAAPAQYQLSPVQDAVAQKNFTIPAGALSSLPRDITVKYTDAAVGAYTVTKTVDWDAIDPALFTKAGAFTVEGTVAGIAEKVKANVKVVKANTKADISTNAFSGSTIITTIGLTSMYRWEDIPEGHAIHSGAMATSSAATANPNLMLQNNTSNWQNTYSGTGNGYQLSTRFMDTLPASHVEFYWDGYRIFDKIDLTFVTSNATTTAAGTSVPGKFMVQYWNGVEWKDVANQSVVVPTTGTNRIVTLSFDAVYGDRVRVGMVNSTPWTNTGGMRIQRAIITGWTMEEAASISISDDFNIYVTSKPAAGSGLFNPAFRIVNLQNDQTSVTVLLAAYDQAGKLLQASPFVVAIGANATVNVPSSIAIPDGAAECKFFVWKDGYLPLTAITSAAGLP
jgi:hypothetical protein